MLGKCGRCEPSGSALSCLELRADRFQSWYRRFGGSIGKGCSTRKCHPTIHVLPTLHFRLSVFADRMSCAHPRVLCGTWLQLDVFFPPTAASCRAATGPEKNALAFKSRFWASQGSVPSPLRLEWLHWALKEPKPLSQ